MAPPGLSEFAFHILEKSSAQIGLIDREGKIIFMNEAARNVRGMSRQQLEGADFFFFFRQADQVKAMMQRVLEKGRADSQVFEVEWASGQIAYYEIHMSPFEGESGRPGGIFCVFRDISEDQATGNKIRAASQYARSLIEASLDPLVTISPEGKIMDVNRATERATGFGREVLIGSDFSTYFTEPEKARIGYQQVFSQGHVHDYPLILRHASGKLTDVLYNASLYYEGGQVAGVFAAARDVTQLRRSQEELEYTNREVLLLGEMSNLLQRCVTMDETFPIIQSSLQRLFPGAAGRCYSFRQASGLLAEMGSWGSLQNNVQTILPGECWALRRGQIHAIGFEDAITPPCHYIHENSPYLCIPLQAQGNPLGILHLVFSDPAHPPARKERVRHLAGAVADSISLALANLRLRESLHELSIHDSLTGLYNRRFMEEALVREISRMERLGKKITVAMIDLDEFKKYNDLYGHEAGDAALKEFARLMHNFREGADIACRFGGEEFLLVLPDVDQDQALKKLEEFRSRVAATIIHHESRTLPSLKVSIGIAIYPDHARTSVELIRKADAALYLAKEAGRNRVEIATAYHSTKPMT